MHRQSKYCLIPLLVVVNGISLRTATDGPAVTNSDGISKYIPEQNIFGLICLALIVIFLIIGFVFKGFNSMGKYKIKIISADLFEPLKPQVEDDRVPLTVVVKLNTENSVHYVVPVGEKIDGNFLFQIDSGDVSKLNFSIILREGNIPIHFESVSAQKFLYSTTFTLMNINEPKLINNKIIIHYSINR